MATQRQIAFISPEEYLEIERKADFRSEYISGQMFAMASPSKAHGQILSSVSVQLGVQLLDKTCESSIGVSVAAPASFLVPDVVVYCDGGDFGGQNDILRNPVVIVEVLSAATGDRDRGEKWLRYQQIESVMHYLLIADDEPRADLFSRKQLAGWHYEVVSGLDGIVSLRYVACELAMEDIYKRVTFPEPTVDSETVPTSN